MSDVVEPRTWDIILKGKREHGMVRLCHHALLQASHPLSPHPQAPVPQPAARQWGWKPNPGCGSCIPHSFHPEITVCFCKMGCLTWLACQPAYLDWVSPTHGKGRAANFMFAAPLQISFLLSSQSRKEGVFLLIKQNEMPTAFSPNRTIFDSGDAGMQARSMAQTSRAHWAIVSLCTLFPRGAESSKCSHRVATLVE